MKRAGPSGGYISETAQRLRMQVEAVMSTDLVTCSVEDSLQEGVERMLNNSVGSVIVCKGESPTGIVTETDSLYAGYVTQRPFTAIPIRKVMKTPLITISREKTLRRATMRMKEEDIKKLVVVEDLKPVGIITTQDIVDNYHNIKAEIHDIARSHQSQSVNPLTSAFDAE